MKKVFAVFLTNLMTKINSHFLTLIAEGKIFSRQQLEIFPYYSQKIGFDISKKWCHPFIF